METVQEEMKAIGDFFKQRRKENNLSLKEVENGTSIRMNYLQAIEEGEVHKLISPVYAQGFVKQYAVFLGVDGEKIVSEHPRIFNRPAPQEFAYGIGTLEMRGQPGAGVKWFPNAMWVGFTLLVVGLAWLLARYLELF